MSKRKAKGVTEVGLEVLVDSLAQQIARKTGSEITGELDVIAQTGSTNQKPTVEEHTFYVTVVEMLLSIAFPDKTSVKPRHVAKFTGWTKGQAKRFLREPETITLSQLSYFAVCAGYMPVLMLKDLSADDV